MHTLRESAAAWGAALNLIPSLGPVVEGYLKQPEGRRLVKAVKDPAQQEFFIQAWQQSGVFKSFFGDEASADKQGATPEAPTTSAPAVSPPIQLQQHPLASNPNHMTPASSSIISPPRPPMPHMAHSHSFDHLSLPKLESNPFNFAPTPSPSSQDGGNRQKNPSVTGRNKPRQESISLSDIVAKDAVRSYVSFPNLFSPLLPVLATHPRPFPLTRLFTDKQQLPRLFANTRFFGFCTE